jgi:predicted dehydrogenase
VKPLRAGVAGLGTMGRHHVRILGDMPDVELVGAADPSPSARAATRGARVTQDLAGLLALGLDMCVVATPALTHAAIGLELAAAGIHTLIEKPLAPDAATGRRLAAAFESRGLVGCVGHVERYNAALRGMRTRLAQGELGSVFQVATRRQGPYPQRIRDVGVVMDLATHDIDVTGWIAGSPYLRVAAFSARPSGGAREDLVAITGMLHDGTVTSHLVNWLSPMKERVIAVTGERGCLFADMLACELWFHRNGAVTSDGPPAHPFRGASEGDLTRYAVVRREALRVELEQFRDAVLGRPADVVTMRQGIAALEVAGAVLDASRAGTTVEVAAGGTKRAPRPAGAPLAAPAGTPA